jgi:hypothetical protein
MKATHTLLALDHEPDITPADLLRGAALYLTRHGWVQGDFFDLLHEASFPPACSLGAINICAHGRPILGSDDTAEDPNTDAAIRAMRVLAAYLDPEYGDAECAALKVSAIDIVSGWNDFDGRTLAEVVEALNDAADEWDRAHRTGGAR